MATRTRRPVRWSPTARNGLVIVAALNAAALAILASQVAHTTGPLHIDEVVWRALGSPRFSRLIAAHPLARYLAPPGYERLAELGGPAAVAAMSAVLLGLAAWWRDLRAAALCVAGPVAAALVTEAVLKPLVDREDYFKSYVFPSGHVTGATAVATVAVVLAGRYFGMRVAIAVAVAAAGLPVLVGVGAVGHHWHYFTDAVGALTTGVAVVLLVAAAVFGADYGRLRTRRVASTG